MQNFGRKALLKIVTQSNSQVKTILFWCLAIVLLCLVGLYLFESFPRYITLSIPLPKDDYPSQAWVFPTYSVIRPEQTRYFAWREYAILTFEGVSEEESRQSIFEHFDKQLFIQGWVRSEYDTNFQTNCYDEKFFPEAAFLPLSQDFSQDGFVTYKKKTNPQFMKSKVGDEICLAVWKHWANVPSTFRIVISTIKPSFFTQMIFSNEQAMQ